MEDLSSLLQGLRDGFRGLLHFLDRAVFVEEEFVDADGAAEALALLSVAVKLAVVVEEVGVSLVVDHAGVNGEAVLGGAGDLAAERPGAARIFGGGVVDAFAAASAGTGVDVVVEAVALIEPRTFDVTLELQVGDLAVDLGHVVFQLRDVGILSPREPGGAVIVDEHGRVDVVPAAAGGVLVLNERLRMRHERSDRGIADGDADALSAGRSVIGHIPVELVALLDALGRPGDALLAVREVFRTELHAMAAPVDHVGRGVNAPVGDIVVAGQADVLAVLVDVFAGVDVQAVADHKRGGVARPGVRKDRVSAGLQVDTVIEDVLGVGGGDGRRERNGRGRTEEKMMEFHGSPFIFGKWGWLKRMTRGWRPFFVLAVIM